MEPISAELVDRTLEETGSLSPETAYEESINLSKLQPGILAFIMELTEDIDERFRDLAIYMFFVIYRIYKNGYGRDIGEVSLDEARKSLEENEILMQGLGTEGENFFEGIARTQMSSQPYVVRYVVETLFDATQGHDPVLPGEEDAGFMFLMMKSIIDVLNRKTET